jgi:hypothetical protein
LALDLRAATFRRTMSSIPLFGSPFMGSDYLIVRKMNTDFIAVPKQSGYEQGFLPEILV